MAQFHQAILILAGRPASWNHRSTIRVSSLWGSGDASRTLNVVGSVITCIDRGFDYEATIMTINGGIYDVRIARV